MENNILEEVNRCLNCSKPNCVTGCPFSNNIPGVIQNIKNKKYEEAYRILTKTSLIPEISCRICPSHTHCESKCVLGIKGKCISIQQIEKFLVSYAKANYLNEEIVKNKDNKKIKIAIIGAGISGLSCAKYLALKGYCVDIFEKDDIPGGIVSKYIPDYRIEKNIIEKISKDLENLGVSFKYNIKFGKDITKKELINQGYKGIFLGIGAQNPRKLNVEGEELKNIIMWDVFLSIYNKNKDNEKLKKMLNKKIVIIGGGSTALDCASVAHNIGIQDITVVYRRTKNEMRVSQDELKEIENTNIKFEYLSLPIKFVGKDKLEKLECIKMKLGEKDINNRRRPIPIENSNYEILADYVILALGNEIDKEITENIGIQTSDVILINENGQTNIANIFAGGDVCSNIRDVSCASALGIKAGKGIEEYCNKINLID